MKGRMVAVLFAVVAMPALARAQAPMTASQTSLRDQLMPTHAAVVAPSAEMKSTQPKSLEPAAAYRSAGTGYMVAGAALFVAGLLVDGDAGTVLVLAGAGIGAYGLYLHFR